MTMEFIPVFLNNGVLGQRAREVNAIVEIPTPKYVIMALNGLALQMRGIHEGVGDYHSHA